MLMIRLQRVGRKHDPKYRVVIVDKQKGPKTGKHVEIVGFYDAKAGERKIDSERVKYWLANGAQVSPIVHNFLVDDKVIEGSKINVLPKRKPEKKGKADNEEANLGEAENISEVSPSSNSDDNKEDGKDEVHKNNDSQSESINSPDNSPSQDKEDSSTEKKLNDDDTNTKTGKNKDLIDSK